MSRAFGRLTLPLIAMLGSPALADPAAEAALRRLLDVASEPRGQLSESFRQTFSPGVLETVLGGLRETLGEITDLSVDASGLVVESVTHRLTGRMVLDADGLISAIDLDVPVPKLRSFDAAGEAFGALGDQVSWLVRRGGERIAGHQPDQPLAVGSAFKLAVISVLVQDIMQGTRDWADVVGLRASHLSLPAGRLRSLPPGAPLTLHTLAATMIAESDNTATDLLLGVLGRDRVARRLNLDHVLSTREFFALKADADARNRYISAIAADKVEIAATAAEAPLPDLSEVAGLYTPGLEWEVPVATLCDLIEEVAHIPLMAINADPADPFAWKALAFKEGLETGVLNLTAAMRDAEDRLICVSLTVNDRKPIDTARAVAAFGAVQELLAGPP